MSSYAEIMAIVEGPTEKTFAQEILVPYLASSSIFMTPIILSKPGQKGGDVKFARARNDIELHLKQRKDTYVTFMVDYYGIRGDWPGYQEAKKQSTPAQKAHAINEATMAEVGRLFPGYGAATRFIPYISMHETEALLFSDPQTLATMLSVNQKKIEAILQECGEPENIDDSSITAPSQRLKALSNRFKKTTTGLAIAKEIGLPKMRAACPLFNEWLGQIESLRN